MGDLIKFPLSAYKLNPEEERRLAESSAFTPEFRCGDPCCNTIEVTEAHFNELMAQQHALEAVMHMSFWDRIFNWPY